MEARKSLNCIHTTSLSNQTLSANSAGVGSFSTPISRASAFLEEPRYVHKSED